MKKRIAATLLFALSFGLLGLTGCVEVTNGKTYTQSNPPEDGYVFAVYSQTDGSLNFYNNDSIPTVGTAWNDGEQVREVTAIFAGFENTWYNYTPGYEGVSREESDVPWYEYKDVILSVAFKGVVKPMCLNYWFASLSNCTIFDLELLDTSETESARFMFRNCVMLPELDLSAWDTSNMVDLYGMFEGCGRLVALEISNFDTSKVTDFGSMFAGCMMLLVADVSGFDTAEATNMSGMFMNCGSLPSPAVAGFDTSKVTNMSSMFLGCKSIKSLDLSHFDTSNVTEMQWMFETCNALTSLDLSGFDTSNVTNMESMFDGGYALKTIDLSSFDTAKVTDMSGMFNDCFALETIYASDKFVTTAVTDSENMFKSCEYLVGGDGTAYDPGQVSDAYARIDGEDGQPGYFTWK